MNLSIKRWIMSFSYIFFNSVPFQRSTGFCDDHKYVIRLGLQVTLQLSISSKNEDYDDDYDFGFWYNTWDEKEYFA